MQRILRRLGAALTGLVTLLAVGPAEATTPAAGNKAVFGPVNAEAHGGGPGLIEWFDGAPPIAAAQPWTISAWVRPTGAVSGRTLVAGFGDGLDFAGSQRYLGVDARSWFVWTGDKGAKEGFVGTILPPQDGAPVLANQWQHLAATYDGTALSFYFNGKLQTKVTIPLNEAAMQPLIAPPPPWHDGDCYRGRIAGLVIDDRALSASEVAASATPPSTSLDALAFEATPAGPTPVNRWDEFRGRRNLPPQNPDTYPQPVPSAHTPHGRRSFLPAPCRPLAPTGRSCSTEAGN